MLSFHWPRNVKATLPVAAAATAQQATPCFPCALPFSVSAMQSSDQAHDYSLLCVSAAAVFKRTRPRYGLSGAKELLFFFFFLATSSSLMQSAANPPLDGGTDSVTALFHPTDIHTAGS